MSTHNTTYRIMIRSRTELGKGLRRSNRAVSHSDKGCPFGGREWLPSPHPWSNTISSVNKDNYLIINY